MLQINNKEQVLETTIEEEAVTTIKAFFYKETPKGTNTELMLWMNKNLETVEAAEAG